MGHHTLHQRCTLRAKDVVCDSPLFLGPQELKIPDGTQDLKILMCSRIKTSKLPHPEGCGFNS